MLYFWKCVEHMVKKTGIYSQYTSNHNSDGTKTGKAHAQLASGVPNFQTVSVKGHHYNLQPLYTEIPESSKPQQQWNNTEAQQTTTIPT